MLPFFPSKQKNEALHSSQTREAGSNKKGRALDHSVLAKKGDPTRNARKGGKKEAAPNPEGVR